MNLVTSDFFMLFLGIPPDLVAAYQGGWTLGYTPCMVLGFTMTLTGMGTVYSLTMLSLQRCVIVWQPIFYCNYAATMTRTCIPLIWILASSIALPPLLGWTEFVPEQSGLRYVNVLSARLFLK